MSNSELPIEVLKPKQITEFGWEQLQAVSRAAFSAAILPRSDRNDGIRRTQSDVDYLVRWGDFARFHETHLDPNVARGDGFNSAQSYHNPIVAVTFDGASMVGFAYGADNVSGSALQRLVKMNKPNPSNRFYTIREIAVKPEYQGQGIAKQLGRHLLSGGQSRSAGIGICMAR